jgi:hypothetical protein
MILRQRNAWLMRKWGGAMQCWYHRSAKNLLTCYERKMSWYFIIQVPRSFDSRVQVLSAWWCMMHERISHNGVVRSFACMHNKGGSYSQGIPATIQCHVVLQRLALAAALVIVKLDYRYSLAFITPPSAHITINYSAHSSISTCRLGWLDNFLPQKIDNDESDQEPRRQYPEQYPASYELSSIQVCS